MVTTELVRRGHTVVASDISDAELLATRARASRSGRLLVSAAALPHLPFADAAFDTVVCAHTLEHVPRVHEASAELRRVARKRLIVVVPRQRYYRYTLDYHVHFFPSAAQLAALLDCARSEIRLVDGDWLYIGDPG